MLKLPMGWAWAVSVVQKTVRKGVEDSAEMHERVTVHDGLQMR